MVKLVAALGVILLFTGFLYLRGLPKSFVATQDIVTSKVEKSLDTREYASVNLEKIFDGRIEEVPSTEKIVLLATGDVIPARAVNFQALQRKDFLWPYTLIASTVSDADLTLINLETPLMKNCPPTQTGMIFCGSDKHIEGLKTMGVDVASIANNHAGNHGIDGVMETKELLEANGISMTGEGKLVIKEVRGIKFGFLGFNDIAGGIKEIQEAEEEAIKSQIQEARPKVDVLVVEYHWGVEYQSQPDNRQKELGHLTIDSGADLVIGNHPHWVQPVEIYKGKVIMYAHGNTIFDQEWSEKTKQGVLGRYIFAGKQLVDVEYIPIGLKDYGQAFLAEGDLREKILSGLKKESAALNSR